MTARRKNTRTARAPKKAGGPKKRPWWVRLLLLLFALGLLGGVLGVGAVAGLFYYYGRDMDLPHLGTVRDYRPPVVTSILDRQERLVGEISAERRTVVPFERMPKLLIKAVLSSEDADFFKHRGLDYWGMFRAFLINLRAGRFAQGGSTITQQVVKTFFLSPERTIKRKMQEVILARRLENELSKEEILFLYLNQIYFGHGRYGVEEASRFYVDKGVARLNLGELSLLAGLPQSPERLSPFKHPRAAKRRQTYVLKEMVKTGAISQEAAQKAIQAPIQVVRNTRPYYNEAPEITDLVRAELLETFGEKKLSSLGLRVHTTVDVKLQQAAREAVQWGLATVDARQGYRKPLARLKGKRRRRVLKRLKRQQTRFSDGQHYKAVVTKVNDTDHELEVDLGGAQGRVHLEENGRYNPQKHAPSQRFAPGDLIWVRAEGDHYRYDAGPQAALVAMDPQTGEVLAMVGGYDFSPGNYNRATQAQRQPGSAFKPLTYAAALESGKYTAATTVVDEPVTFGDYEPKNYEETYLGPVRLRQALAHSINTVAVKVIQDVGVDAVRKLATDLGISTPLGQDLSLALGSSEVKVIDLATVYCAMANGGKALHPRYIQRVGKQALKSPEPKQVLSPEVAFIVASMMQSVVQEGTGRRALRLRRPVAGKTGTTNGMRDAWFVGYTPQLVAVVWVGFDDSRGLGRGETGSRAALPIWLRFMQKALRGKPRGHFEQPAGVVVKRVDAQTGLLPAEGATQVVDEYFVLGTEPKEVALPADPNIPIDPYPALDPTDPNRLGQPQGAGTGTGVPSAGESSGDVPPVVPSEDAAGQGQPGRTSPPIPPKVVPVAPVAPVGEVKDTRGHIPGSQIPVQP